MEPTYHAGDMVVAQAGPPYGIGEAVVYRLPAAAAEYIPGGDFTGRYVVHRITGADGQAGYTLQGDNAAHADFWPVTEGDIAGRVVLSVPVAGRLLALLRNPLILASLAAGFVFVLVAWPSPSPKLGRGTTTGHRRLTGEDVPVKGLDDDLVQVA